jgi:uncharacterized membrane protein YfcA
MLFVAVILALAVGLSLGMLGGGGSILTVPILRYALGMEGHQAIAMSLLVVGATSLAGLIPHARRGRVQWRTGIVFGGAGMLGAFLAGRVAHLVPAAVLLSGFALMMFATSFAMLRERRDPPAPSPAAAAAPATLPLAKVLAEGLVVGAVTGLVGAGGGFLVVPALVLLGKLPMDVAVGTSLLVIAMKSFAGLAGFLGHTTLDLHLAAWISAAAVAGSVAGGALAGRVKAETLRQAFGWLVVAMAFFIVAQELASLLERPLSPALAGVIAAAGTALVIGVRTLSRASAPRRRSSARRGLRRQLPVTTGTPVPHAPIEKHAS